MADDKKISELPLAVSLGGTETIEIVQGGVNKSATAQQIADLGTPNSSPTLAEVLVEGNDAAGLTITNLSIPFSSQDAATKGYVDGVLAGVTQDIASVLTAGNDTSGIAITGLPAPSAGTDATNKTYVDSVASGSNQLADYTLLTDAAPIAVDCGPVKEPKFYLELSNSRTLAITDLRINNVNLTYSTLFFWIKKKVAGDLVVTLDSTYTNIDMANQSAVSAYTLSGPDESDFFLTAVGRGESSSCTLAWNLVSDATGGGGGAVDSVNGATGTVVLDAGDIGSTATGNLSATNVQAALAELDSDLTAHISDSSAAHSATAISFTATGTISSTNVQAAIAEVASEMPGTASPSAAGIAKLYTSTGGNTDGSMDQQSITNAISAAAGGTGPSKVQVATTANITLSGEQTIDGILTSGSRVLVWQQSSGPQNGVYVSSSGSWTRATDFDSTGEVNGMVVQVMQGTRYANKLFSIQTYNPTIGSTSLVFYPVQIYDRSTVASTPILNHAFITEAYSGFRPATAGPPRIYIVPNGTPSGTRSKFEMFFTDYFTGSSDYAGFNIFGSDSPNEWHIGANVGGSGPTVNQYYGFYVGSALQTSKAYREMLNSTNVINDFAPGGHVLKHFKNEISTKTGAATLALTDWNKVLDFNSASDANITVPLNSSVSFPVGVVIPWVQRGAGKLTFVQGSGSVTIISLGSLYQSAGQGACGVIRQIIADTWVVAGQLI